MRQQMEKVYVKVNSDFDSTGYMLPRMITWSDGRTFKIDAVKDFRPASTLGKGTNGRLLYRGDPGYGEAPFLRENERAFRRPRRSLVRGMPHSHMN